jgi:hypothetical protein
MRIVGPRSPFPEDVRLLVKQLGDDAMTSIDSASSTMRAALITEGLLDEAARLAGDAPASQRKPLMPSVICRCCPKRPRC